MDILVAKKEQKEVLLPSFFNHKKGSILGDDALSLNEEYLATQVINDPSNLRRHTQRIFCIIKLRNRETIYGALCDLFFVLDKRGLPLRKRLLTNAYSLLTNDEFEYLQSSLKTGLKSGRKVTSRQEKETFTLNNNAMDDAKYYAANGFDNEAIKILQEAILKQPRQLALHYDLLELYQKTAKKSAFISFYRKLLESHVVLPKMWKTLAVEFDDE